MDENKVRRIEDFLCSEYERFVPALNEYQWPWEAARWHELAFCLLVRIDDSPDAIRTARETIEIFRKLNLLTVDALAKSVSSSGEVDFELPQPALILAIMERQGYGGREARAGVAAICQTASALKSRFDGKIQKYLRHYGELMLDEADTHFPLTGLSSDATKMALAHWLQNVLNMPVILPNVKVRALCEELAIQVDELVEMADHNDINLALVDDWVTDYVAHKA